MLDATVLVYSSHNRSHYIHREWIVERALRSPQNKTLLHLPMSMNQRHEQEYGWDTFRWYLERFQKWGLRAHPFFWDENLAKEDVEKLFRYLEEYEVVILGGGNPSLGMRRYRALGEKYFGNPDLFREVLHRRQASGKLTVGFSAGASQLVEVMGLSGERGFGLGRNLVVSLHHEWGREEVIRQAASRFPMCFSFGLPNDSGLALQQRVLGSGVLCQVIEFVIDCSWDLPQDAWHIKTRQGMGIEHYYCDGRHWTFRGGDRVVRLIWEEEGRQEAWIFHQGGVYDYWTQSPVDYGSVERILAAHG